GTLQDQHAVLARLGRHRERLRHPAHAAARAHRREQPVRAGVEVPRVLLRRRDRGPGGGGGPALPSAVPMMRALRTILALLGGCGALLAGAWAGGGPVPAAQAEG